MTGLPERAASPAPASAPFRAPGEQRLPRVLLVDDEEDVRVALSRFLTHRGYDVVAQDSGAAALALLSREHFDIMLCDILMPQMSGLDVVPHALRVDRDLAVVMLTAFNDASTATKALALGAMDYLVKPFELAELLRALERVAHRRTLEIHRRKVEELIRDEVASYNKEIEQERLALRQLTVGVADTLINAMEAKNVYLRGHSRRVADLAASVAEELENDADIVENVRMAGRLHDVGKIGIRESVLNKPDTLSPEEFAHVRMGMEILLPLKHMPVVLRYVHDHHEHFDGSGYPRGLVGEEISIGGRILAACDAFDALTSQRAYRGAIGPREAVEHLAGSVGGLLDPVVFTALQRVVLRRKTLTFMDETQSDERSVVLSETQG